MSRKSETVAVNGFDADAFVSVAGRSERNGVVAGGNGINGDGSKTLRSAVDGDSDRIRNGGDGDGRSVFIRNSLKREKIAVGGFK